MIVTIKDCRGCDANNNKDDDDNYVRITCVQLLLVACTFVIWYNIAMDTVQSTTENEENKPTYYILLPLLHF